MRTDRRAHGSGTAHHRTALAVEDYILGVGRRSRHPLVGPEAARVRHRIGSGAQFALVVGCGGLEHAGSVPAGVRPDDNSNVFNRVRPKPVYAARMSRRLGVEIGNGTWRRGVGGALKDACQIRRGTVPVDCLLIEFVGKHERQVLPENRLEVRLSDSAYILDPEY